MSLPRDDYICTLASLPFQERLELLSFCSVAEFGRVYSAGSAGRHLTTSPLCKFLGLQKLAPRNLSSCYELLNDDRIDWPSISEFVDLSMTKYITEYPLPRDSSLMLAGACLELLKVRLHGSVRLRSLKFCLISNESEIAHVGVGLILSNMILRLQYLDRLFLDIGRSCTDQEVAPVIRAISTLPRLRFLSLYFGDVARESEVLGSSTVDNLVDMLWSLDSLSSLSLHGISDWLDFDHSVMDNHSSARNIGTALARCRNLKHLNLDISGTFHWISFVQAALKALIHLEDLRLHLRFREDDDDLLDCYIDLMKVLHTLTKLRDLSFCFPYRMLAGWRWQELVNGIWSLQSLQDLRELRLHAVSGIEYDAENHDFDIELLRDFCYALGCIHCPLIHLDLRAIKIKDSSASSVQQLNGIMHYSFWDSIVNTNVNDYQDPTGRFLYRCFSVEILLKPADERVWHRVVADGHNKWVRQEKG